MDRLIRFFVSAVVIFLFILSLAPDSVCQAGIIPPPEYDVVGVSPERSEPVLRPGPPRKSTDETRMILGDLSSGTDSRWLDDILVQDTDYDEIEPALHKAPDGTLFIAVEQYGTTFDGWVRVYRSTDDGQTWSWLVSFTHGEEARNPSITYAERTSGEKWVFLTFEVTMSDSTKRIRVIRFDPDTPSTWDSVEAASFTYTPEDVYPRICTDNLVYDLYYVYLTYTVNAIDYFPVMFTRSLDYGLTFTIPTNITGGAENSQFVTRPDITYGTAGLFVAFEKLGWTGTTWETQVWMTRSTNYGSTWDSAIQLTTSDDGAWHPSIAAAVGVSTVMVAFTYSDGSQTDIRDAYSTDGGDSFSAVGWLPWNMDDEKSVALTVSDSNGRYHAAFWRDYDIRYTSTDTASPGTWLGTTLVNDYNWASSAFSRPAICVNPTAPATEECRVAWTDFRDGYYHIYFDNQRPPTIAATFGCNPSMGTVPFATQMAVSLDNLYTGQIRRLAGRIDVALANGASVSNWRSGYTNVAAGDSYSVTWWQNIPAVSNVIGDNVFSLIAVDITPSPYNQPPYPPAGDSDTASCTVTAVAP